MVTPVRTVIVGRRKPSFCIEAVALTPDPTGRKDSEFQP